VRLPTWPPTWTLPTWAGRRGPRVTAVPNLASRPVALRRRRSVEAGLGLLRRAGLLGPAFRTWERVQGWRSEDREALRAGGADGLPLPPQRLVVLVAGPTSSASFLRKGALGAAIVREALARQGVSLDEVGDLLDFGVGCGRVARHWHGVADLRVHGCDVNAELVDWTAANLPFVDARLTGLEPPLPYTDASFGAIYAFSVLTHLPEELGLGWARELRRVLRPGGHLVLSTHGDAYLDRLDARERAAYDEGRLVVHYEELAGANLCNAFHPPAYLASRFPTVGLEPVEHVPEGARANGRQDLWTLRAA
jgi:SAM-dependent methyltransferase